MCCRRVGRQQLLLAQAANEERLQIAEAVEALHSELPSMGSQRLAQQLRHLNYRYSRMPGRKVMEERG